jgi:curved DNA-binding protein CbpA
MNAFQIFGVDPFPAIDMDEVKKRYLEWSASTHPDVGGAESSGAFAELNEAYKILSSDRLRLKHLLELCGMKDPGAISAVPRNLGDLFMKAGGVLNASNRLIKEKAGAESVLEQAALQGELLEKIDELQELLSELSALRSGLRERLAALNLSWQNNPQKVEELKEIYLEFSYLEKWIEQVQEKAFLLS